MQIRTIGVTICNVNLNVVGFGVLKLFPTLMASIGLHFSIAILCIVCVFGSIYVFLAIKETKGLSLDMQKQHDDGTQKPNNRAINGDISQIRL